MKKPQLFAILAFVFLTATAGVLKINQAPNRHTNAPGESSCGNCHGGNINNGPAIISFNLPNEYIPGETYLLSFGIDDNSFPNPRFGFTTTALNSSNLAGGNFIVSNSSTTSLQLASVAGNQRQYIGHRNANDTTDTWAYYWTAPPNDDGPITFYTVGLSANGNNNTSGDQVYIQSYTIHPQALPPTAGFSVSGPVCEKATITFTDTSSGDISSYLWSFGPNASLNSATTAGPHIISFDTAGMQEIQLIVSGSGGIDTFRTNLEIFSSPELEIGPDTSICQGSSIQLIPQISGGLAPFTASWTCGNALNDPTILNPIANPPDSTFFCLQITDSNACSSNIDSLQLNVIPAPIPPLIIFNNDSLLSQTEADFFQWFFVLANGTLDSIPGANASVLAYEDFYSLPSNTGQVLLQVQNVNGCISVSESFGLPFPSSIVSAIKPDIVLYPNPGREEVRVSYMDSIQLPTEVRIFAINGRIIFEAQFLSLPERELIIPTESLNEGIYLIEIRLGSQRKVFKWRKE